MGVGVLRHAPAALPSLKRPDIPCLGGWVGPRPVWQGVENLTLTGIRFLDRSARSKSLYQLCYPGPHRNVNILFLFKL
jgi:hypothetical protein